MTKVSFIAFLLKRYLPYVGQFPYSLHPSSTILAYKQKLMSFHWKPGQILQEFIPKLQDFRPHFTRIRTQFYKNSGFILHEFGPIFTRIWATFYENSGATLQESGLKFIRISTQFCSKISPRFLGPKMAQKWPTNGPKIALKMAQKWPQNGSKIAQKWLKNGPKIAQK